MFEDSVQQFSFSSIHCPPPPPTLDSQRFHPRARKDMLTLLCPPHFALLPDVYDRTPWSPAGIVAAPGAGWARIGFDWLNYTWPNASHRFLNSARAGGGPEVYADCMNKAAPQVKEADLVVLEFGITGSTLPANTERVIRQLLAMKPTPAIIMVNFVEWCRGNGVMELCSGEEGREANISLVPLRDRVVAPHMTLTGLAAHYDIPAVSMVELVWPSYFPGASLADAKTPPGTMLEDPAAFVAAPPAELSAKEHLKKHYSDGTHPTELGNSLAGAAFAYALQLALQKKATGHHSVSTRTAKDPPLPWPSLLPPTRVSASVCYDFFNATGPSAISSVPGYMMAELLAEWPPVVASSGFQYEEMVPNLQGDMRFKPGFVAYEPGSFVELVLDLDGLVNEERHQMEEEREEGGNQGAGQMEAGQARASDTYTLNLVYLISYEHMGKALVTCSEGCACSGAAPINAHTKVHHSVTANQIISLWRNVAPEGSHQMCQIQIKVVKETDSGEHKFKLVTVVLQKHVRLNAAAGRKKRLYRAKRRSRQEA